MKTAPLSFAGSSKFPTRRIQQQIKHVSEAVDLRQCNLAFLFGYHVFPPAILKFFGEWQLEKREMRTGDTIVQQAQVPPGWGVYAIFGVRVLSIFHDERRAGFSYGTLAGHPEVGVNEFSFSVGADGVVATVKTTAGMGLISTCLLAPLTRRYVNYCNREALRHICQKFVQWNSNRRPRG
jgi:hypothetical protein